MAVAYTRSDLSGYFERIRWQSEKLCEPLEIEDYCIQVVPEASPAKWHLAHTTWFFETFVLKQFLPDYDVFHPQFEYLFNSYYNAIGQQYPRALRGAMSRPTVAEVYRYRSYVDKQLLEFIANFPLRSEHIELIVLGLNHEQQHQELMLTDLKRNFWANLMLPALFSEIKETQALQAELEIQPLRFDSLIEPGLYQIGNSEEEFAFDNERPAHKVYLQGAQLADRVITNGEYLDFIEANGYQSPLLWLSDGWAWVNQHNIDSPLYWLKRDGHWYEYTLVGLQPINLDLPVSHISYYEADAFSRWYGARLPTEAEWEVAADQLPLEGQFVDRLNGLTVGIGELESGTIKGQWFGTCWQWTQSSYLPYPGYRAAEGAVGEYNSKFMGNQMVLRGGSCATPMDHFRKTYRNFFYPHERWQFTGIRLADDLS